MYVHVQVCLSTHNVQTCFYVPLYMSVCMSVYIMDFGGLNKNDPHRLIDLTAWTPVSDTIWKD